MVQTIPYERRRLILEALQTSEVVFIDDLISLVGVSSSTVRRDVNTLVERGEVTALRGGAVKLNDRLSELPATTKALINQDAKRRIAAEAARQVVDGDTIYLDSGTTTLMMLPFLMSAKVQIVTSNTQVFAAAPPAAGVRVIVVGGEYLANLGSVVGPIAERQLGDMFYDKAFIGASGCSVEAGVNTFDLREAAKKRIVHEHSRETFVLVDGSKLGRTTMVKALEIGECAVVTDREHPLLASTRRSIVVQTDPVQG